MSLGIAHEYARNIICHPCAVDLMINETIYYTARVGGMIFSRLRLKVFLGII